MKIVWAWRHEQSPEYLLTTQDARFELLAYLARQNEVYAVAPTTGPVYQLTRWGTPHSGEFMVAAVPGAEGVLQAVQQLQPDVLVVEGGLGEAEWGPLKLAAGGALCVLYYGGGPLWTLERTKIEAVEMFDVVIVPHPAQVWRLRSLGVQTRIVRAWGIPLNIFHPDPTEPRGAARAWRVLHAGNFAAGKRPALVAQALEQYPQPAVFVGALEDLGVYDMTVRGGVPMNRPGPPRNGAVLAGRMPQPLMPWLYRQAEVLVSGSQEEGHPNGVFEAMACGTPAIVMSDCLWDVERACRELIEAARLTTGLQVVDPSPTAIAHAIERVMADRAQAREEARLAIGTHYDWWAMYWTIDTTFRTLLAARAAAQEGMV